METSSDRLKIARVEAGYENAREAADALGVNYTTYGQHENGTRNIPAKAATRYARKFKVSLDWLLNGRGDKSNSPLTTSLTKSVKLGLIQVVGLVKAGAWQDIDDSGGYHMAEFVPSSSDYPLDWQLAYTVDGESLNKIARHGDRLICLDLIKSHMTFGDGDLVIVERSRYGGQMIERTAKRVRKTIDGYELWPESDDPDHQEPIPYRTDNDHDEVRVSARVLWILRKP